MAIMSNDKFCHENSSQLLVFPNEKCVGNLIIEYFPRTFKRKLLLLCSQFANKKQIGVFGHLNILSIELNSTKK